MYPKKLVDQTCSFALKMDINKESFTLFKLFETISLSEKATKNRISGVENLLIFPLTKIQIYYIQ